MSPFRPLGCLLAILGGPLVPVALPAVESPAAAAAAETPVVLPSPHLLVWRDAAQLTWELDLPAGAHQIDLPLKPGGAVAVEGAHATCEERAVPAAAPPIPAAFADLLERRNRWAAGVQALRLRQSLAQATWQRISERLPRLARTPAPDQAGWQAAVDAWRAEDDALADLERRLTDDVTKLRQEAAPLCGGSERAQDVFAFAADLSQPLLTSVQLASRWNELPRPAVRRRILHLWLAQAGRVRVDLQVAEVTWQPSAVIRVDGPSARLIRQVHLRKSAGLDLAVLAGGAGLPVSVCTGLRTPPLAPSAERPVNARLRLLAEDEGRRAAIGSTTGSWGSVSRADVAAASSPSAKIELEAVSSVADEVQAAGREEAVSVTDAAPPGLVETWDLGPLALGLGEASLTVDRPVSTLPVTVDEWALIPQAGAVLTRRLGLQLDARPLLAGELHLVVDGQAVAQGRLPLAAPGTALWLRGGEDATVFAEPVQPWKLTADDQPTPRRVVAGSQLVLRNLGTVARTVTVYRTMSISRSEDITITLDPRTTPGSSVVSPGVLRWQVPVAAGGRATVDLGWIVIGNGRLRL